MDAERLTSSRHEMGKEQVDLGVSSVDAAARVQETREAVCPERIALD